MKLMPHMLHAPKCQGLKCQEAKAFTFSFEREAMILAVGYSTQLVAGHLYTIVVAVIYLALAAKPSVKAARQVKAQAK